MQIDLLQLQNLDNEQSAHLEDLKRSFCAFVSTDYVMGKNLPYWGESAQPSKTHYMMKLVCDVFGIVDHGPNQQYTYLCDKVVHHLNKAVITTITSTRKTIHTTN